MALAQLTDGAWGWTDTAGLRQIQRLADVDPLALVATPIRRRRRAAWPHERARRNRLDRPALRALGADRRRPGGTPPLAGYVLQASVEKALATPWRQRQAEPARRLHLDRALRRRQVERRAPCRKSGRRRATSNARSRATSRATTLSATLRRRPSRTSQGAGTSSRLPEAGWACARRLRHAARRCVRLDTAAGRRSAAATRRRAHRRAVDGRGATPALGGTAHPRRARKAARARGVERRRRAPPAGSRRTRDPQRRPARRDRHPPPVLRAVCRAGGPRDARREWAKVQGRFQDIPSSRRRRDGRAAGPRDHRADLRRARWTAHRRRLRSPRTTAGRPGTLSALPRRAPGRSTRSRRCCWDPVSRAAVRPERAQRLRLPLAPPSRPAFQEFLQTPEIGATYDPAMLWDYLAANFGMALASGNDGGRFSLAFEAIERRVPRVGRCTSPLPSRPRSSSSSATVRALALADDFLALVRPAGRRSRRRAPRSRICSTGRC